MKTFNKIAIALGILLALVVLTQGAVAGGFCEIHNIHYLMYCPKCFNTTV